MKLTPEKIIEIYRSATPYQVESVMNNYIGQEVFWNLKLFSVTPKNNKKLSIGLMSNEHNLITCEINENDFPLIKIIAKDTPINLIGTIKSINGVYIDIEDAELHEVKDENGQIYFTQGSKESLLSFLESKILGAKDIKIYDPYPGDEILNLLETTSSKANIRLLGKNIDSIFLEKVNAFNIYIGRSMVVKRSESSHARFYIIDGEVNQVDTSLKNFKGKATTVHLFLNEEAKKIKDDFDKWWNCGIEV